MQSTVAAGDNADEGHHAGEDADMAVAEETSIEKNAVVKEETVEPMAAPPGDFGLAAASSGMAAAAEDSPRKHTLENSEDSSAKGGCTEGLADPGELRLRALPEAEAAAAALDGGATAPAVPEAHG